MPLSVGGMASSRQGLSATGLRTYGPSQHHTAAFVCCYISVKPSPFASVFNLDLHLELQATISINTI